MVSSPFFYALIFLVFLAGCLFSWRRGHVESKIVIGCGLFPDAVPLMLAAKYGFFGEVPVEVRIINWSRYLDFIAHRNCDIIFAPKRVVSELVARRQQIDLSIDELVFYRGFTLLCRQQAGFKTFADNLSELSPSPGSKIQALQMTLEQLIGKTVLCVSDDAREVLEYLKRAYGMEFTVRKASNPEKDFREFLGSSTYCDAFVGGVTHLLIGKKLGLKTLVGENDVSLRSMEAIVFVGQGVNSMTMVKLVNAWYTAVNMIRDDDMFRREYISALNYYITPFYQDLFAGENGGKPVDLFDEDDFVEIWRNLEIFPKDPIDAKRFMQDNRAHFISEDLAL